MVARDISYNSYRQPLCRRFRFKSSISYSRFSSCDTICIIFRTGDHDVWKSAKIEMLLARRGIGKCELTNGIFKCYLVKVRPPTVISTINDLRTHNQTNVVIQRTEEETVTDQLITPKLQLLLRWPTIRRIVPWIQQFRFDYFFVISIDYQCRRRWRSK